MGRRYKIGGGIKLAALLQSIKGLLTRAAYSAWHGTEGGLMVTRQLPCLSDELRVNLQKPKPVTHRISIANLLSFTGCYTRLLWLVTLCFAPAFAASNSAKTSTHCKPEEKVIFSCSFKNGKTVSLCASPDLSKETGTLQYRFGRIGQRLELSYPASRAHPRNYFWYWEADAIFPARATYVGFSIGSLEYSLIDFEAPNTDEYVAYLRVSKKKKVIASMVCPLSDAQNFIGLVADIGLPDPTSYKQK